MERGPVPLKPDVQQVLDLINSAAVPISQQSPEQLRTEFDQLSTFEGPAVASVTDHTITGSNGEFTVRVYRPNGSGPSQALPGLVWYHGGGFVIGSIETADSTCRDLANRAGIVVVSVGYHLAPEFPFPAAVDDALDALSWTVDQADELGIDASRLAVGGDSAGGNLAAVVTQLAKAAKRPRIQFQLLAYPVTDIDGSYPSMIENAEGYLLTSELMRWFRGQYLGGRDGSGPRVSPLHSTDLSGLPPALVITAEFDPLRDEGEAYAAALKIAGVPVELLRFDGVIHGFFGIDFLSDCGDARAQAADALQRALGSSPLS